MDMRFFRRRDLQNLDRLFHAGSSGEALGSGVALVRLAIRLVDRGTHFLRGRDAFGGNVLAAGRVIERDGENQRAAVVHFDQLLLRRRCRRCVRRRCRRACCPRWRWRRFPRGRRCRCRSARPPAGSTTTFDGSAEETDGRDRLALQSGDGAGRQEKLSGRDAFGSSPSAQSRRSRISFFAPFCWNCARSSRICAVVPDVNSETCR